MLKSINKRGFTLVEVLCSLAIFSIIFICMISYDLTSLNIKKSIKAINNNVLIMEALKNNIIGSMTFEELEQLQNENRIFINNENMSFDKIENGVMNVFTNQASVEKPYIELSFLKCEFKVYRLRLSLHDAKQRDISGFQCIFYKGRHK